MADMSRHDSASSVQGFSVFQASLGAPLQFLPALGTKQLDDLINAYLPGPASVKDKRATISMDFCEYARMTGETFKYYAIFCPSFGSVATDSPASSGMHDSGYGSSFNASPVAADMNLWARPSASFVSPSQSFISAATPSQPKARAPAPQKASASTARAQTTDFSHLPGMKIMTKDGQDVTTAASRGCKTKEQRDHAHLMRILKACEACRKKKIRCDPSHKKRTAAQVLPEAESVKPAKRSKKRIPSAPAPPSPSGGAGLAVEEAPVQLDLAATTGGLTEESLAAFDESWEQFVHYDLFDQPANVIPPDYNPFLFDAENLLSSPSSGSSSVSPTRLFTSAPALPLPLPLTVGYGDGSLFANHVNEAPTLPYLASGVHGSNYVDFNLYSPASSFLDEEPQTIQETAPHRNASDYTSQVLDRGAGGHDVLVNSPASASASGVDSNSNSSTGETTRLSRITSDLEGGRSSVPGVQDTPDVVLPGGALAHALATTVTVPDGSINASSVPGHAAVVARVPHQRHTKPRALGETHVTHRPCALCPESNLHDHHHPAAGPALALSVSPSSSRSSHASHDMGRPAVPIQSPATGLPSRNSVDKRLGRLEGLVLSDSTRRGLAGRATLVSVVPSSPSIHEASPQHLASLSAPSHLEELQPLPKGYLHRPTPSSAAGATDSTRCSAAVSGLEASPDPIKSLQKQAMASTGASRALSLETPGPQGLSIRAPMPRNRDLPSATSLVQTTMPLQPRSSTSAFFGQGENGEPFSTFPVLLMVLGLASVAVACASQIHALASALDQSSLLLAILSFTTVALRCDKDNSPKLAARSRLVPLDRPSSRLTNLHPTVAGRRSTFSRRLLALPATPVLQRLV